MKGNSPISKDAQRAIKAKKKAHRYWMSVRDEGESLIARKYYAKTRNKVKNILRREKKSYEKKIAASVDKSPKLFWSYVRR